MLDAAGEVSVLSVGDPSMADAAGAAPDLAALVGPPYDRRGLKTWVGVTDADLDRRVAQQELLQMRAAPGSAVYPTWQFMEGGSAVPHLGAVLNAIAAGIANPCKWALWLTSPEDGGGGRAVWQWLTSGDNPQPIDAEARSDGAKWAT